MARHPAKDFVDAEVITASDAGYSEEENLFTKFRQDAQEDNAHPMVQIWRLEVDPVTNRPRSSDLGEFCTDVPMDTFKHFMHVLSFIRDTYGGGYYRVKGGIQSPDGQQRTHFTRVYRIAAPVDAKREAPAKSSNDLAATLKVFQDAMAQQRTDNENMLRTMVTMMRGQKPDNPLTAEKIGQWVILATTIMGHMKGLFAPAQAAPLTDLTAQISQFRALKDLLSAETGTNPTNDADVLNSLVKTVGPMLAALAMQPKAMNAPAALPAPAPAPAPVPVPVPAPVPAASKPINPSKEENTMDPRITLFRSKLSDLLSAADRKLSPESVADLVLTSISDADANALLELMEQPDILGRIEMLEPRAVAHRAWLEAFRAAIIGAFENETAPEDLTNDPAPG